MGLLQLRAIIIFSAVSTVFVACSSTKDPNEPRSIVEKPKTEEEVILANASNTYDQGLFSISEENWTQLRDGFPASYFAPLAELKVADAQYFRGDYPAALASYDEFARLHPGHEALPYIRYQIANCHLEQYRGRQYDQTPLHSAIKVYQTLIEEHPDSEYVIFARRNLDRCRQLLAEHEVFVSEFYSRRGVPEAAENRKRMLYTLYPDSIAAQRASSEGEVPSTSTSVALSSDKKEEFRPSTPQILTRADIATEHKGNGVTRAEDRIQPPQPVRSSLVEQDLLVAPSSTKASEKSGPVSQQLRATALVDSLECGEQGEREMVFIAYLKGTPEAAAVSGNTLTVEVGEVPTEESPSSAPVTCKTDLLTLTLDPELTTGPRTAQFRLSGNSEVLELRVVTVSRPNRVILFAKKKTP